MDDGRYPTGSRVDVYWPGDERGMNEWYVCRNGAQNAHRVAQGRRSEDAVSSVGALRRNCVNKKHTSTQSRAINYPTEQSLWGNTRAGGNKNEQESPKGEQKQNSEQRKSQEMSKKRKASI